MIPWTRPLGPALALLLIGLGTAGCDSNTLSDTEAPPVLEPDAFAFETSTFPETNDPSTAVQPKAGTNVAVAATSVGVLSAVVAANLVIPWAVTAAALEADPTVEDGTWIWRSSTQAEGTTAEFRLEGTPEGDRVFWRMFVTASNPIGTAILDNFELYTAETSLNRDQEVWSLYYPLVALLPGGRRVPKRPRRRVRPERQPGAGTLHRRRRCTVGRWRHGPLHGRGDDANGPLRPGRSGSRSDDRVGHRNKGRLHRGDKLPRGREVLLGTRPRPGQCRVPN